MSRIRFPFWTAFFVLHFGFVGFRITNLVLRIERLLKVSIICLKRIQQTTLNKSNTQKCSIKCSTAYILTLSSFDESMFFQTLFPTVIGFLMFHELVQITRIHVRFFQIRGNTQMVTNDCKKKGVKIVLNIKKQNKIHFRILGVFQSLYVTNDKYIFQVNRFVLTYRSFAWFP